MSRFLMKCGHVDNAITLDGKPSCVICGCHEVLREANGTDGLENRQARCCQHKFTTEKIVASRWDLPFFKYCPSKEYDEYYCGCWGWD